jgi:hypothetical protein
VVVSAAAGWEFADLGGTPSPRRRLARVARRGRLARPVSRSASRDGDARSVVDVAPAVLAHFGVGAPAYALAAAA